MDSLVRAALPTLQGDDKETVADFLGSQQKLGRRFKKDLGVVRVEQIRCVLF
jgi:hypothetical protein